MPADQSVFREFLDYSRSRDEQVLDAGAARSKFLERMYKQKGTQALRGTWAYSQSWLMIDYHPGGVSGFPFADVRIEWEKRGRKFSVLSIVNQAPEKASFTSIDLRVGTLAAESIVRGWKMARQHHAAESVERQDSASLHVESEDAPSLDVDHPPVRLDGLVAVVGPQGGAGKTLLSSYLGSWFAQHGYETCVIDLDLMFGDIRTTFDLANVFDLVAWSNERRPAESELREVLAKVGSNLWVLPAPEAPDLADIPGETDIASAVKQATAEFDIVIADTAGADEFISEPLRRAQQLISVFCTDHTPRAAQLHTQALLRLGVDVARQLGVLHERGEQSQGLEAELEDQGIAVLGRVPHTPGDFPLRLPQGSISPNLSTALEEIATGLRSKLETSNQ